LKQYCMVSLTISWKKPQPIRYVKEDDDWKSEDESDGVTDDNEDDDDDDDTDIEV
jgi:hypothetical protein